MRKLNMAEIDDIFHKIAAAFANVFDDANIICFPSQLRRDQLFGFALVNTHSYLLAS